jgi:hypothetical protein
MWIRWDKSDPFSHGRESPIPAESYGKCKRAQKCGNWNTLLGDGFCVDCWDREWSRIKSGNATKEEGDDNDEEIQSEP